MDHPVKKRIVGFSRFASTNCASTLLSLACALVLASPTLHAQDGTLDPTFGRNGTLTTDFFGGYDNAASIALQADGKIIAAGSSQDLLYRQSSAVLARYHTNGELDWTFGFNGRVSFNLLSEPSGRYGRFDAIVIQPDQKILALGFGHGGGILVRLDNNGSLDRTFGDAALGGGIVAGLGYPRGLALQTDGKIVVALGDDVVTVDGQSRFAGLRFDRLARYNSDGTLDMTFGTQGTVVFLSGDQAFFSSIYAVTVQHDGKIVAAGERFFSNVGPEGLGTSHFVLARYDSNGNVDHNFGSRGVVRTAFVTDYEPVAVSTYEFAHALTSLDDGKIVAAGAVSTSTGRDPRLHRYVGAALARYHPDGTLDRTFGNEGKVLTPALNIKAVVAQQDGRIIAAGGSITDVGGDFALLRYTREGMLDSSFGTGGVVSTDFSNHAYFECPIAAALALQNDGKIVAAGMARLGYICSPDFALARFVNIEPVAELIFTPTTVSRGTSLEATFSGSSVTASTYFDVRFVGPDIQEGVALNWQHGPNGLHETINVIPGTWTVTGIRPHESSDDHSGPFLSVFATLAVVD